MKKLKVLSTKKLAPGLHQKAAQHGIQIFEQEFISIEPVWNEETHDRIVALAEEGSGTIAVTSPNAASILDQYFPVNDITNPVQWKCYCIAGKTKETLLSSNRLKVDIAGEAWNGAELADVIIRDGEQRVLFFCGDIRRDELPQKLRAAGIGVEEIVLYKTIATPVKLQEVFDAVLFYSPSGVQSFFAANELLERTVCFSIGLTTKQSIEALTKNRVISSPIPETDQLLDTMIEYFQQG